MRALYLGVVLFVLLAAFTAHALWLAWLARSGESRARAVFDLVEQRTAPRPTDAPGAMAWLRLQLDRYADQLPDESAARLFRDLSAGADDVPSSLDAVARALRLAPGARSTAIAAIDAPPPATTLRVERVVADGGRLFVISRRARIARDAATARASDAFALDAMSRAHAAAADLESTLPARPLPSLGSGPTRIVRVYAVSEDGTLVSLPWQNGADAAAAERDLLGARPELPTFAPEEFFFRSRDASGSRAAYSGLYLDLGGRGLVSTVIAPFTDADGARGVMAADVAFGVDWPAFAASVEGPVEGAAVHVDAGPGAGWAALAAQIPADAPAALAGAASALGGRVDDASRSGAPIRHSVVAGVGTVAAFYVADGTWLLMLFPDSTPAFPFAPIALLVVMLGVLLTGFEVNRRRAESERRAALRAFEEKQNLLNTMQVPLVVVDPNTDVIAASNRAAEALGIRAGSNFGDLIWPDAAARAHYERMQVATPEPRRAYGVPVRVHDAQGRPERRFALVRSVAVTAPIESLSADERHRLGILFLVDPESDLALFTAEVEQQSGRRERQRLAGLLSHGVETLARVLDHTLKQSAGLPATTASSAGARAAASPDGSAAFAAWLAEYLERRLQVTAWLLDHWDATPPLPHDNVVDAAQARATIARLTDVFEHVRDQRTLRARLHWDNGTLSAASGGPVLDVSIDWPETYVLTTPVRGGFGLFMGEVLANAVKHGLPGSTPTCRIEIDRVRRELEVVVENECQPGPGGSGEPYGGLRMLDAMARLFDWRELTFTRDGGRFVAAWRIPVSARAAPGEAD